MMQLTARQVRAYKGAAISILMLYLVEGHRPLSQGEMRRGTGYGNDSVHDAVMMLQEDGLLVQVGRGDEHTWGLLDEGMQQLPIGAGPTESELVDAFKEVKEESKELTDGELPCLLEEGSENSGVGADEVTAAALEACGFYGAGVAALLQVEGLTMRDVRFQVHDTRGELNLALWRLKRRRKVPEEWERDRAGPEERRSEYAGGRYAGLIQT